METAEIIMQIVGALLQELGLYMLIALLGSLAAHKVFQRVKREVSPREVFLWVVWVGLLVAIIVFRLDVRRPLPALEGTWVFLSGIFIGRFMLENPAAEMREEVDDLLERAEAALEGVEKKDRRLDAALEEFRLRSKKPDGH